MIGAFSAVKMDPEALLPSSMLPLSDVFAHSGSIWLQYFAFSSLVHQEGYQGRLWNFLP